MKQIKKQEEKQLAIYYNGNGCKWWLRILDYEQFNKTWNRPNWAEKQLFLNVSQEKYFFHFSRAFWSGVLEEFFV